MYPWYLTYESYDLRCVLCELIHIRGRKPRSLTVKLACLIYDIIRGLPVVDLAVLAISVAAAPQHMYGLMRRCKLSKVMPVLAKDHIKERCLWICDTSAIEFLTI